MREIEHRYLLGMLPPDVSERAYAISIITQGYFSSPGICERVTKRRRTKDPKHPVPSVVYRRTVKQGHGLSRLELKDKITEEFFRRLYAITEGSRILKCRHRVHYTDSADTTLVWELDKFLDRDLFLAEVEVPSVDYPVEIPAWLQDYVVREVTESPDFEGTNLAK